MMLKTLLKTVSAVDYEIHVFDGEEFVEAIRINILKMNSEELLKAYAQRDRYERAKVRFVDVNKAVGCLSISVEI